MHSDGRWPVSYTDCDRCGLPTLCSWETGAGKHDPDVLCHDCQGIASCAACGYPREDYSELDRIAEQQGWTQ